MANYVGFGTFSLLDTLASTNQTIASFGVDKAFEYIDEILKVHNEILKDMRSTLMEDSTDRLRRGGSYAEMIMQELDEFGTPNAQKITAGANIGFPLRRFGGALQWTYLAMKRMTTPEMAAQVKSMMDADVNNLILNMKTAFYRPTNLNYTDRFVDNLSAIQLPVKALQNADGFPIAPGPNGEFFDPATHTHYLVAASTSTFAAADMDALITTVREHQSIGQGYVAINQADVATVTAFAKFKAVVDTRIIQPNTSTYVDPNVFALDVVNTNDRLIGIYDGVEVWVKPWTIASYPLAWWTGPGIGKPLVYRYDPVLPNGLTLTWQGEPHNLKADVYESFYGIGVWNRIVMAVLDVGHGSYTSPL